ncbi:hypothetical protein INT47_005517 [Mucor saturninus]|uniref:Uncharacterized protein n=1 Tax=Mucor saturninus TaxID=64648 RepID=A0A8H7V6P7_9FUNG|nr:hypothetical protein INT47_005517 [Mucor saturninus]
MTRTPIYPEVEKFIILKKRAKLEKVKSDSAKESSTTLTPKRTSTKRKDSPNVPSTRASSIFKETHSSELRLEHDRSALESFDLYSEH